MMTFQTRSLYERSGDTKTEINLKAMRILASYEFQDQNYKKYVPLTKIVSEDGRNLQNDYRKTLEQLALAVLVKNKIGIIQKRKTINDGNPILEMKIDKRTQ